MFICDECKQKKKNKELSSAPGGVWCYTCVEVEDARHRKEDCVGRVIWKRPPRYMINSRDYNQFGF
jgi:hypothetical protein